MYTHTTPQMVPLRYCEFKCLSCGITIYYTSFGHESFYRGGNACRIKWESAEVFYTFIQRLLSRENKVIVILFFFLEFSRRIHAGSTRNRTRVDVRWLLIPGVHVLIRIRVGREIVESHVRVTIVYDVINALTFVF